MNEKIQKALDMINDMNDSGFDKIVIAKKVIKFCFENPDDFRINDTDCDETYNIKRAFFDLAFTYAFDSKSNVIRSPILDPSYKDYPNNLFDRPYKA